MADKLDAFDWHEALDRAHCITVMLTEMLENHQVIEASDELSDLCDDAIEAVCKLYQGIARATPDEKDPTDG